MEVDTSRKEKFQNTRQIDWDVAFSFLIFVLQLTVYVYINYCALKCVYGVLCIIS